MSDLRAKRIQGLGYRRDSLDARDQRLQPGSGQRIPDHIDLSPLLAQVAQLPFDQGQLGSCTGNGVSGAIIHAELRENETAHKDKTFRIPSRLWLYLQARKVEGTIDQDAGAEIRDVVKAANKLGYPDESFWPYDISKFATDPSPAVYTDAKHDRVYRYKRVDVTAQALLVALAAGYPVVVGTSWYSAIFDQASGGNLPMPGPRDRPDGGHCYLVVGADVPSRRFKALNSWGAGWGAQGYMTLPFEFLGSPSYGGDYWIIEKETTS